jgi:hypothetical protein
MREKGRQDISNRESSASRTALPSPAKSGEGLGVRAMPGDKRYIRNIPAPLPLRRGTDGWLGWRGAGGIHLAPEQHRLDVERQRELEATGLTFVRIPAGDIATDLAALTSRPPLPTSRERGRW